MKFLLILNIVFGLVLGKDKPDFNPSNQPMKILVSMTFGSRSHIKNVFEIGKELQARGHSLSYMALEPYLRFADGYNITRYQIGPSGIEVDDHRGISDRNLVPINPLADTLQALVDHLPIIYRYTFEDVLEIIDNTKPDILICDFFSPSCIDAGIKRNLPVITGFQTLDGPVLPPPYITGPLSYFPLTADALSYPLRLYSTLIHPLTVIPGFFKLNYYVNQERAKFGIPATQVTNLGNWDSTLKLCNTFTGFELARPLEPTMKLVGPIMSDDYPELSPELNSFLDTKHRVLYIAFGSGVVLSHKDVQLLFQSVTDLISNNKADGVVWALGKTPASTFNASRVSISLDQITLTSEDLLNNLHPSIRFIKWAPQVAILNHQAVRVFLSHGGLESIFEATYSGTPILTMPFFGDQYRNARKVVEMGYGGFTDRFTQTPHSLYNKMRHMLEDKDGSIANSILHWQVVARMNSKKKSEAADLVEEMVLTSRICRKAPGTSNHQDIPCEIRHLVPGYHKMNPLIAYGFDVFGTLLLILGLSMIPALLLLKSIINSMYYQPSTCPPTSNTDKVIAPERADCLNDTKEKLL